MVFIVVHFLETDEVSIITHSWLVDENTCKWPPYKNKLLIKRALLEKKPPENEWEDCEIFIMGIHETYAKAKKEVATALNTDSDDDNPKPESKRKKVDSVLKDSVLSGSQVNVKQEVFDSVSTSTPSQSSMSDENQETAQSSLHTQGNNQSSASVLNRNKESTQVSSQNLTNGEFLSLLDSEVLLLSDDSTTQNIVLPDNVSMQLALIPSNSSSNGRNESTSGLSQSVNNNPSSSSKSSSCICSHSKDFQYQVLSILDKIISIQDRMEEKFRTLETGVTVNHNVKLDKFNKIYKKFPFKHENDVEEFEILLKNRDEIGNVIHVLKGVGGANENEMLQNILKKIFSDDVAEKYTWNGKSGKRMFKNLQLAEVIHNFQRQLLQALEDIKLLIKKNSHLISCLIPKERLREEMPAFIMPTLPLRTSGELQEFENLLVDSEKFRYFFPEKLFKVQTATGMRKSVQVQSLVELKFKASQKLNLCATPEQLKIFFEDGTEIDEDEVLSVLPEDIILYVLKEDDEKPWSQEFLSRLTTESSSKADKNQFAQLLSPWIESFQLPTFSVHLQKQLQSGLLDWSTKSELLGLLSQEIRKYSDSPSTLERNAVGNMLITKYPSLKSNIGEGYEGWAAKIYDRVRRDVTQNKMHSLINKKRYELNKKTNTLKDIVELHQQSTQMVAQDIYSENSSESSSRTPEASSSSVENNFPGIHVFAPWPMIFDIPTNFSNELQQQVMTGDLDWSSKRELLGVVSEEIRKYTLTPTNVQRDIAARALVSKFPSLKSKVGEGHEGWALKIYDRVKQDVLRSKGIKSITAKKRKQLTNDKKMLEYSPKIRKSLICGQMAVDFTSEQGKRISEAKTFMLCEMKKKKSERNISAIQTAFSATFQDRMQLVYSSALLNDLKMQYPVLFTVNGIEHDFNALKKCDLHETVMCILHSISPAVELFAEKKKRIEIMQNVDDMSCESIYTIIKTIVLIPKILGDQSEFLYKEYPIEATLEDLKVGPLTPHVAVVGDLFTSTEVYIIAEDNILIDCCEFVEAIITLIGLYCVLNIEYPKEADGTFKFFESYVFKFPSKKLPRQLITFCNTLP